MDAASENSMGNLDRIMKGRSIEQTEIPLSMPMVGAVCTNFLRCLL